MSKSRSAVVVNVKKGQRHYYDACTLDVNEDIYRKLLNAKNGKIQPVTSHLSIGEAVGNVCFKLDKRIKSGKLDEDQARNDLNLFVTHLFNCQSAGLLKVVGNDGVEKILEVVLSKFGGLDLTDCVHLATAMREDCNVLLTMDGEFVKRTKKKRVKEVADEVGLNSVSVREPNN
ncbi:PIN domain-containing protein [Candidatus Woesearchaeota archaeon]|nr:PIN domain-containing protein [Candidatus Woesearchaeota archaeon]